jgi:hypothetical protein
VVSKIALGGLLVIVAAGAWLVAAPFVLRYQAAGAPWTGAAKMDVAVGAVLVAAGLAGFFAALSGQVAALYDRGAAHQTDGAGAAASAE